MYAAKMSSLFNAFLLGYSFPAIISAFIILLGATVLRSYNVNKPPESQNSNANIENPPVRRLSGGSIGASFINLGGQMKPQHVSYNEKFGVTTFFLGLLIIIFTTFIAYGDQTTQRSSIIAGDVIAFFSAVAGIIFHLIFLNYSMRRLYRILEFLFLTYLFSAIFLTA